MTTLAGIKLQEILDQNLRIADPRGYRRFSDKGLTSSPFINRVLAEFDRINEAKLLAGGQTGISDSNLPAGFVRTVIREALADLKILDLVQAITEFSPGVTVNIPYETRDTSAMYGDGVVFEGQPIPRASIKQEMQLAYVLPMKLAFVISNEVMHFSRTSGINWDAFDRNVKSNARVLRELVARRIANELQRAADAYGASDIADEAFDLQLTGSNSIIKTAEFPIVRPHQERNVKGEVVGSPENPITLTLNGTLISEFNGSGTQAAGTYYRVTNYNLGYIQLVDEAGTPVTPSDTGTNTISYSYATNVAKFDLDNGTTEIGLHLNGLLRTIGARKAALLNDRFVAPEFVLMSHVLNDTVTNANNFEYGNRTRGNELAIRGDLEEVKGLPAWSTSLGCDLGDQRILIGQRSVVTYALNKPLAMSNPFEMVDANGRATGMKQAYAEEYNVVKVPTAIRSRLTSVIAYSASAR